MTDKELIAQFEVAFSDGAGSCRGQCACGRIYYNSDGGWSWEEGELDELRANKNAQDSIYTIGYISFEGATYTDHCDCWHPRALKIAAWLLNHDLKIAAFLTAEKKRLTALAARAPAVNG